MTAGHNDQPDDPYIYAKQGDVDACILLANRYAGLDSHDEDVAACVKEYIQDARVSADSESFFRAGMAALEMPHLDGIGPRGLELLGVAAAKGHWLAQNNLAVIFGRGLYGVGRSDDQCLRWMSECISNPSFIQGMAGEIIYPGNTKYWLLIDRACYWYERAANAGSAFGMLAMALLLGGHKSTGNEALAWLRRAMEVAPDAACIIAALMARCSWHEGRGGDSSALGLLQRPRHFDVLATIAAGANNGSARVLDQIQW